jgi:hypothetical protein
MDKPQLLFAFTFTYQVLRRNTGAWLIIILNGKTLKEFGPYPEEVQWQNKLMSLRRMLVTIESFLG